MKFILHGPVFALLVSTFASIPQKPPPEARDFRFDVGNSAEALPFRMTGGYLFVPVSIQNTVRWWFLDTGTTANIIDRDYAVSLDLRPEGSVAARGASQSVQAELIVLPPYSLPGVRLAAQKIPAIPLNGLFKKALGVDVAGILGYDFLSRFVVKVDYAARTLSLYDPNSFDYKGNGTILAAPVQRNQFTIEASVDGRYKGRCYVDTGSPAMDFHYPFAAQNGFLSRAGIDRLGGGIGGTFKERKSRFETIEIGGFIIMNPVLSWPMEKPEGSFGDTDLAGNLGNPLLRHFTVFFDYTHERIILEKGADFDRTFPEDRSGLQLMNDDNGDLSIFYVAPGTPAEAAGLSPGDVIQAVDGNAPEGITSLPAVREILEGPAGTRIRFRLKHNGMVIEKELILKDLLPQRQNED